MLAAATCNAYPDRVKSGTRLPLALALALAGPAVAAAQSTAEPPAPRVRKPKASWVLQVGLSHSANDGDHYAVSGFHGRFPLLALDRRDKSDRFGGFGLEVGLYPYPVISRAYVPGPDADPDTPGKFNFWEAAGLSYYSPWLGPLQFEAGARLAFINVAERVLTSPNGCGIGNRDDPRCNAYIKESLKTLDTIFFPSFRGDRGVVTFVAGSLVVYSVGVRIEWARLNSGGSRINASGLRYGITVR
jgi:hypothetical protein